MVGKELFEVLAAEMFAAAAAEDESIEWKLKRYYSASGEDRAIFALDWDSDDDGLSVGTEGLRDSDSSSTTELTTKDISDWIH